MFGSQVWSLLNVSSDLWSSPCLDRCLRYWEKGMQCRGSPTRNGQDPQAYWFHHLSRHTNSDWLRQEVFGSFALGGGCHGSRSGWWRGCVHRPEESLADERELEGLRVSKNFQSETSLPHVCWKAPFWGPNGSPRLQPGRRSFRLYNYSSSSLWFSWLMICYRLQIKASI